MKRHLFVCIVVFAACCAFPALSDDYQTGFKAYERGDYVTAVTVFTELAEQGDVNAQYSLGLMHERGLGVPKDANAAGQWFLRAASQGNAEAQFKLGAAFHLGQGVAKDDTRAQRWLRRAANQGVTDAQVMLGEMLFLVRLPLHDNAPAYMWMSIAASSGNAIAIKKKKIFSIFMTPNQLTKGEHLAREWKAQFNKQADQ